MNTLTKNTEQKTPGLIPSLTSGFNLVANNIQLILLPIIIDLVIWLGPRLRVKNLLSPFVTDLNSAITSMNMTEVQDVSDAVRELWQTVLEHFNLLSMLRTYPIGVPSLIAGQGTLNTPYGIPVLWEIPSSAVFLLLYLGIVLVGAMLGVFYFSEIARYGMSPRPTFSLLHVAQQFFQILLFSFCLVLGLGMVMIPLALILSLFSFLNPVLMQFGLIFIGFSILWLLMPLIFSTHGIFAFQDNILAGMLNSARIVRYFLPATGFFIVSAVLISEGLDVIWMFAPENSWMTLIGIAGHAFIATSLVASSFAFYRQGITFLSQRPQISDQKVKSKFI